MAFAFGAGEFQAQQGEPCLRGRDHLAAGIAGLPNQAGPAATSPTLYDVNVPFEQDILPRAYAAKGDLDRAIAEYEKLLTFDPSSKDRRLKNPRYEYRLAKLLEKRGSAGDALAHYNKFLEYWKNADPDQPELVDAKARVQALTN